MYDYSIGRCIQKNIGTTDLSQSDARSKCAEHSAELVTIDTYDVQNNILKWIFVNKSKFKSLFHYLLISLFGNDLR